MNLAPNPRLQRTRWRSPLSRQPLGAQPRSSKFRVRTVALGRAGFGKPTIVLMIVVLSISLWSGCASGHKVVVTGLRVGGDDGLTQRFADALQSGIDRSPDFVTDRK